MTPRNCDFCASGPSEVTVTREGGPQLRLCLRCADLHQFISLQQGRTAAVPGGACFYCGGNPEGEATCRNAEGHLLGRVRLCRACAGRTEVEAAHVLRVSTLWTPGVLELAPPTTRVFPPPPADDARPPFGTN